MNTKRTVLKKSNFNTEEKIFTKTLQFLMAKHKVILLYPCLIGVIMVGGGWWLYCVFMVCVVKLLWWVVLNIVVWSCLMWLR